MYPAYTPAGGPRPRIARRRKKAASRNDRKPKLSHVSVLEEAIGGIIPSPENDQLYRPVDPTDPAIIALAKSIGEHGIKEPLVLTLDWYILSGHRRFAAAKLAGLRTVPCRFEPIYRLKDRGIVTDDFMRLLAEFNRQREKSFDERLREEVLAIDPEQAHAALSAHRQRRSELFDVDTLRINGEKTRCEISKAKQPFLVAIRKIINDRRDYWPLSDRMIHYALLNDPPLRHASKPNSLYQNNRQSYQSLVELLTRARLECIVPMDAIADPTRPVTTWLVHHTVGDYVRAELADFCGYYWRDLLQSQPNHIEIVAEKNTVEPIVRPVASEFCIPLTIGRGYCSLPPRHAMSERFVKSGKQKLVLLILSDFDPDGEEIAHSFVRSMRDDFQVYGVEAIKVALTADQVDDYGLPPVMTAKESSVHFDKFTGRYGHDVFELEALDPADLQQVLREAIESVLDIAAYNHEVDREKADAARLEGVRHKVKTALCDFAMEADA